MRLAHRILREKKKIINVYACGLPNIKTFFKMVKLQLARYRKLDQWEKIDFFLNILKVLSAF